MESKTYRVEERSVAFKQIMPATELKSNENIEEAKKIITSALKSFEASGIKNSEIPLVMNQFDKSKDVKAAFGVQYV